MTDVTRLRLLSYMTPGFPVSLFECIADAIDADLELDQTQSGPAPGDDPFASGAADFGWICSTSYVGLATGRPDPSVRLAGVGWVPEDPGSGDKPQYFGDVVVRQDSPIHSFDDLDGRSLGCNDVVSLSGHMAFRLECQRRNIDSDSFADMRFTGGHRVSLDRLVAGELDAAVVDSIVRTNRAASDSGVASLRVVQRLGPWPVQPLVARADLDPAVVERVQQALLNSNDDPAMQRELQAASLRRFVATGTDHYDPIRAALEAVG